MPKIESESSASICKIVAKEVNFGGITDRCVTKSEGIAGLNEILRSAKSKGISLIVLVLPCRIPATGYNAVKFFRDIHHGIHTSWIVSAKQKELDWNYFTNVALKINLKLGGINHSLEKQADGSWLRRNTPNRRAPHSGKETKDNGIAKDGVKGPEEATGQPHNKDNHLQCPEKEQSQVGLVVSADRYLG